MPQRAMAFAAVLSFLAWAAFYALWFTVDLPTTHLDGAFQSASSVYRLYAGYLPGRDFMPYLGIGPTFAIYPAFRVAGASLAASEFSTYLMTLVFSGLSISLLWHLILRPASFLTSIAAGASFLGLIVIAALFVPALRDAFDHALTPGNSLRPIRTAAPSIAVAVYVLAIRPLASATGRTVLFGVATGITCSGPTISRFHPPRCWVCCSPPTPMAVESLASNPWRCTSSRRWPRGSRS